MNEYDVRRLALVLAVQAEIEGMKAANMQKQIDNADLLYNQKHFDDMAQKLSELAYAHNDQLL